MLSHTWIILLKLQLISRLLFIFFSCVEIACPSATQ